jgi:hypothetical protein
LARPGGNFTGVIFITSELGTKRLELLRQLTPKATTVAILVMPSGKETVRLRRSGGPHIDESTCSLKISRNLSHQKR